jgi:hypothetical protein
LAVVLAAAAAVGEAQNKVPTGLVGEQDNGSTELFSLS